MRLVWLLVAASAVVGVDAPPGVAQVAATATIKAKVRGARRPPPPRPVTTASELQALSLTLGPGSFRAYLLTPTGERITLELEDMTATRRLSLLVSDFGAGIASPPIECRISDVAEQPNQLSPALCEELIIRWPDSESWPARLSIGRSVSSDILRAGQFMPRFTIVAEY